MNEAQFDASSDPTKGIHDGGETPARGTRPFLGIRFKCCRTYGRIYRNDSGTSYSGRCPKCFSAISVPVGEGGSKSRFFSAG